MVDPGCAQLAASDGRSPGSRIERGDGGLPGVVTQWHVPAPLSAYSCGGSRGVAPRSLFSLRLEAPSRPVYDPARGRSNHLRPGRRAVRQEPPCGGAGGRRHPPPWRYVATGAGVRRRDAGTDRGPPGAAGCAVDNGRGAAGLGWRRCRWTAPVLVDCLTLWTSNLLLAEREPDWPGLLAALDARDAADGAGVERGGVGDRAGQRAWRGGSETWRGCCTRRVAARAERVVLMVAGIAMVVK